MYPLDDSQFSLTDVARHWRRFIEGPPTIDEVYDRLLEGFWCGELLLRGGDGKLPTQRADMLELLRDKVVNPGGRGLDSAEGHRFAFWVKDEEAELGPASLQLSDGRVEVDLRHRLRVPAHRSAWSDEILDPTYENLARVPMRDLPVELQIGLKAQQIAKADFALFCDLNDHARPAFWFGPCERNPAAKVVLRHVGDFKAWFAEQIHGRQLHSKEGYYKAAKQLFSTLSLTRFTEEWERSAPASWKKPGRRKGLTTPPISDK